MGICSSCLGRDRRNSDTEDPEHARLLRHDSRSRHYGGASSSNNQDTSTPATDPEQLKQERDALERICAQTADNLIYISEDNDGAGSKSLADYARLFHEIFPPPPQVQKTLSSAGGVSAPEDEQAWLRSIMRDPNDKSWDCDVVHETGKPLIIIFDP